MMKNLMLSLLLMTGTAHAQAKIVLRAGAPVKAAPSTIKDLDIVGAYESEGGKIILVIRACGRQFEIGIPRSRLKDESIYDQILDYLKAECAH
jgi:hypothetical protein